MPNSVNDSGVGESVVDDGGQPTGWRPNFPVNYLQAFHRLQPADARRENVIEPIPPNMSYHVERVNTANEIVFFMVHKRYSGFEFLASGGQGVTAKAVDKLTNKTVVIKKVDTSFKDLDHLHDEECEEGKAKALKATVREVKLLKVLNHPGILKLRDIFSPSLETFTELYHVTDYVGTTLQDVRRKYTEKNKRMTHSVISNIICQVLEAVAYLHRLGIIHRDLKPSNIAVDEKMHVTILDLGWSRRVDPSARLTQRVGTRLYNAPELLYIMKEVYDFRVDSWAIGCIMGELIRLSYTFQGRTIDDLYSNMTKILGSPSNSSFYKRFIPEDREKLEPKKGRKPNEKWQIHFRDEFFADAAGNSPLTGIVSKTDDCVLAKNARSFLENVLKIDFTSRWTVEQCLKHPYISHFGILPKFEISPDAERYAQEYESDDKLTAGQWKERLIRFVNLEMKETMQEH